MKKGIVYNSIAIALLLSPLFIINWIHGTHFPPRIEYLLLFQMLVMFCYGLSHKNKYLSLFMMWAVINYFMFGFKGGLILQMIFFGLVFMQAIKRADKGFVLKCLAGAGFIIILSMTLQALGVFPLKIGKALIGIPKDFFGNTVESLDITWYGLSGVVGNPNFSGAILAFILPIVYVFFYSSLWLVVVFIVLSKSTGAMVAGGCGLIFCCIFKPGARKKKAIIIALLCILIAGGFCFIQRPDYTSRIHIYKEVYNRMFYWNIFTGHGTGSFALAKISGHGYSNNSDWLAQAHNEYLQCYYEFGLIGLGLVLAYLGSMLNHIIKCFKKRTELDVVIWSSLIVVLVLSLVSFTFHHALMGMFCLTFLAQGGSYEEEYFKGGDAQCPLKNV